MCPLQLSKVDPNGVRRALVQGLQGTQPLPPTASRPPTEPSQAPFPAGATLPEIAGLLSRARERTSQLNTLGGDPWSGDTNREEQPRRSKAQCCFVSLDPDHPPSCSWNLPGPWTSHLTALLLSRTGLVMKNSTTQPTPQSSEGYPEFS